MVKIKAMATCVVCKNSYELEVEEENVKLAACQKCGCREINIEIITD